MTARYRVNDLVQGPVFWMTVREIVPMIRRTTDGFEPAADNYRCTFGSSDSDAGNWRESELTPYQMPDEPDSDHDYSEDRMRAKREQAEFANDLSDRARTP